MQFYLNRSVNSLYKTCITRYRINSHVLNIESGRYFNIVRNERMCTMCNKKSVEDEYHCISSPGHRPCELLSWVSVRRPSVSFSHLNLLL